MVFNDSFLNEIAVLVQKYELIESQTERFNIFSVLHKMHDEKRLHSRFISALLDPFGSHDLKYTFLNLFLSNEGLNLQKFENALVYPQELDKREEANIDILVIDRITRMAIIIENKIFAPDSNHEKGGQLERYFDYIIEHENILHENITVLYLTPDGREPSLESLGKYKKLTNINGKCITYSKEIVKWLDDCLLHVKDKDLLLNAILQYKKLLNIMTNNDSSIAERKELRNKVGENESNLESAKYLIDNFKHIKWHTVRDFWDELSMQLTLAGFQITSTPSDVDITNATHFEDYKKGQKGKQAHGIKFTKNNISIWIWHQWDKWLFWGIDDSTNLPKSYRNKFKNTILKYNENEDYVAWEKDCLEDDNEKIYLSDFSYDATFNLINQQNKVETVRRIVHEIVMLVE